MPKISDAELSRIAGRARADLLLIFEEMGSALDGKERDEISHVRFLLGEIEDGGVERSNDERGRILMTSTQPTIGTKGLTMASDTAVVAAVANALAQTCVAPGADRASCEAGRHKPQAHRVIDILRRHGYDVVRTDGPNDA